jgi:hypothetical protein
MRIRLLSKLATIAFVIGLLSTASIYAQKWSGENGNEWIVEGQVYARIPVLKKGIFTVDLSTLPAGFPTVTDPNKLQLWHRGAQVAIIEADANKVVFYGVPNDGKFDDLLNRPDINKASITSRMNKHVSLYSEEGVYFLTVGEENGLRALTAVSGDLASLPNEEVTFHSKIDVKTFKEEFSHSTSISIYPPYLNGFGEYHKTLTGVKKGPAFGVNSESSINPFVLSKLDAVAAVANPPKVKVLLHNRCKLNINIKIQVKPTGGTANDITTLNLDPFTAAEYEFDLTPDHYDSNKAGSLDFSLVSPATLSMFSVSYYSITFPQNLNLENGAFNILNFPSKANNNPTRIKLFAPPAASPTRRVLDISKPQIPKIVDAADLTDFYIERVQDQAFNLLVTSENNSVESSKITLFTGLSKAYADYKDYDFFIITTKALSASAELYKIYRAGTRNFVTGEYFKPLLINVEDVYDQYNFGEPSPVAIRRYVDFLLTDKILDNKYLFLIGNATTIDKGIMGLKDQVPTIGYPGADYLLVSGLAGQPLDYQTIPVGRLPVGSTTKIDDYLAKVKKYENLANLDNLYRKNVIHLAGGKNSTEVSSFSVELENAKNNYVVPGFGGNVIPYVKPDPCPASVGGFTDCQTYVGSDLADRINQGAGAVFYYGHGNPRVTDYFCGYVSDNARGYTDTEKYTSMFFYGCDVNNVFAGKNENTAVALNNNNRRPFTLDWLLTPNRGAVTVVGNTWEGYEHILTPLLQKEYAKLFVSDKTRKSVGDILKEVSNTTLSALPGFNARVAAISPDISGYNYNFTQANIHQTSLLGDPSIVTMLTSDPLPVEWSSVKAKLDETRNVLIEWGTATERNNSHFLVERSSDAKSFEQIGVVDGKGNTEQTSSYSFYDRSPLTGINYYRLAQVDMTPNGEPANLGKRSYSRIVSINNDIESSIYLAPNPTNDKFSISSLGKIEIESWSLISPKGAVITNGATTVTLDLSKYPSGVYVIEILTKDKKVVRRKLVKE